MVKSLSEEKRRFALSFLAGAAFLVIFFVGVGYYDRWSKEIWEKDKRVEIMKTLVALRSSLENELYARIYYTRSVAAYVSLHPDVEMDEFFNLAGELLGEDEVINSMALSPDGVIAAVYPREGHEEAIGLDLFAHPERKKIVEQTIETGKTFVAGPVELVEGGIAFISYTPVFDKTQPEPWEFWGVADIVILEKGLFEAAELKSSIAGVSIAMRGVDGKGAEGEVFFGDPEVFASNPVDVIIHLPDGEWILAGVPEGGWSGYLDQDRSMLFLMVGSSTVIAILAGFLVGLILKLGASRRQLQRLNKDKDRLLSVIAHDLRSPISAITSLSDELMLPGDLRISEEQQGIVQMINQSAGESLLLLENLLSWVRSREEGQLVEFVEIDLSAACSRIADSFVASAHHKSVRIENQIPAATMVIFDSRVLETILRNLVSNAVKFSPKGGVVRFRANDKAAEKLEIAVDDEGPGMSASRVEEVLADNRQPASQDSYSEGGAGVGLVLCRDLLRQCGEKIQIESAEGRGTTVSFTVPKKPE